MMCNKRERLLRRTILGKKTRVTSKISGRNNYQRLKKKKKKEKMKKKSRMCMKTYKTLAPIFQA